MFSSDGRRMAMVRVPNSFGKGDYDVLSLITFSIDQYICHKVEAFFPSAELTFGN